MNELPVPRATQSATVRRVGASIRVCVLLMMGLAYLMHTANGEETHAKDDKSAPAFAFATEPGGKNERVYILCKGADGTNANLRTLWIGPTEQRAVQSAVTVALSADSSRVTFWKNSSDAVPSDEIASVFFAAGEYAWKAVYLRGESPGDTVLHFKDAATGVPIAADLNTVVFSVQSIEPDAMPNLIEVDDGDGDPKTRAFVVPVAGVFEVPAACVVVRAHLDPVVQEDQLPDSIHLEGGVGNGKLIRNVARTSTSKTEFTFTAEGRDSGLRTTVYVYDARLGLFADEGDLKNIEVGHSWARYGLDEYAKDLIPPDQRQYLADIGFWPSVHGSAHCVGDVRLGADAVGGHFPSGSREYPILFEHLTSALSQVEHDDNFPPTYDLLNYNCTDYAIELGQRVNVYTMDPTGVSTPWAFSGWLNTH